jgi:GrpB-like predicted nucleotidyltransferase (UPF0157 family)
VLVAIRHIGSTSIPLCDAKPIIDMVAAVTDLELLDELTPAMEALGYEAMGEFGIPGRRYFRKGSAFENRTHQVHAFRSGSPEIDRHLAFRDFLRAHPRGDGAREAGRVALVAECVALKRRLAAAHPTDVPAYTAAKSGVIQRIEDLATASSRG